MELYQLKMARKPDKNLDGIIEVLKEEIEKDKTIKIFQNGKTVWVKKGRNLVRLTWNDGQVGGWRDPLDVKYNLEHGLEE